MDFSMECCAANGAAEGSDDYQECSELERGE